MGSAWSSQAWADLALPSLVQGQREHPHPSPSLSSTPGLCQRARGSLGLLHHLQELQLDKTQNSGTPTALGDNWARGAERRDRDSPGWGPPLYHSPGADPRGGREAELQHGAQFLLGTALQWGCDLRQVPPPSVCATAPVTPGVFADPEAIGRDGHGMPGTLPRAPWVRHRAPTSSSHSAAPPLSRLPSPTLGQGQVTFPFLLHHKDTGWIFGKKSKLKRRLNAGPGRPGQWWNHHPWKCPKNGSVWHFGMGLVGCGQRLDFVILEVFSSLNNSIILSFLPGH